MDMNLQPEELGVLFETSRDAVIGIDQAGKIVFANPAAAAFLAVSPGCDASSVVPEHILQASSGHFIASLRLGGYQANASVTSLGPYRIVTYLLPQQDPAGRSPATNRALQELSNSLMTTRLAMDALLGHTWGDEDTPQREAARMLYRDYFRMKRLVSHMTLAANAQQCSIPFTERVTNLNLLCRELCDTLTHFSQTAGVDIVYQDDGVTHLTMADASLLEIMLLNLLTNSLSHCAAGQDILLSLARQGDRFIITIEDRGTGISPEKMSSIFSQTPILDLTDPNEGAGLGLYVARSIAERHGGALLLESRPGQGTVVSISLPYRRPEGSEVNSPIAQYRSDGMNSVLTELSVLLDARFYDRRMFD